MDLLNVTGRTRTGFLAIVLIAVFGACTKQGDQSSSDRNDATLAANVKANVIKDNMLSATEIQVNASDGVVQLSGTVDSVNALQRAEQLAKSSKGVKSVRNKLEVQNNQQTAELSIDDAVLTTKVKAALRPDNDLSGLAISVDAAGGMVELMGSARNELEREKAEQLAIDIEGVNSVYNLIEVH